MPKDFSVYEGIQNTVLVLIITIFLKSTPSFMIIFKESFAINIKERNNKQLIAVMKFMKSMMFGLFILTIFITIVAIFGIYVSDVSVNTAHIFALTIPMWLPIRSGIVKLMNSISE
ncbi:hypothetical protein [Abyssisolibacter fermentans]|uniref:hypothetical protein n=1 Tax=Abyssisolibacter fermentans TaxID=1766203 RepID=UPI000834DB55|nr:hypothetical protein [Abyssisolibacter fermentans]